MSNGSIQDHNLAMNRAIEADMARENIDPPSDGDRAEHGGGRGLNIAESLLALAALSAPIISAVAPRSPVPGHLTSAVYSGTGIANLVRNRRQGAATLEQERLKNEREQTQLAARRANIKTFFGGDLQFQQAIDTMGSAAIDNLEKLISGTQSTPTQGRSQPLTQRTLAPQARQQLDPIPPLPEPLQFPNALGSPFGAIPQDGTFVNPSSPIRALEQGSIAGDLETEKALQEATQSRQRNQEIRDLRTSAELGTAASQKAAIDRMERLGLEPPDLLRRKLEQQLAKERGAITFQETDLDSLTPTSQLVVDQPEEPLAVPPEIAPQTFTFEGIDSSLRTPVDPTGVRDPIIPAGTATFATPLQDADAIAVDEFGVPISSQQRFSTPQVVSLSDRLIAVENRELLQAEKVAKRKAAMTLTAKKVAFFENSLNDHTKTYTLTNLLAFMGDEDLASSPSMNDAYTRFIAGATPRFQRFQTIIDSKGPFPREQQLLLDSYQSTIGHIINQIPNLPVDENGNAGLNVDDPDAVMNAIFKSNLLPHEQRKLANAIFMVNPSVVVPIMQKLNPDILQRFPQVADILIPATMSALQHIPKMDLHAEIRRIMMNSSTNFEGKMGELQTLESLYDGRVTDIQSMLSNLKANRNLANLSQTKRVGAGADIPQTTINRRVEEFHQDDSLQQLLYEFLDVLPPLDEAKLNPTGLSGPFRYFKNTVADVVLRQMSGWFATKDEYGISRISDNAMARFNEAFDKDASSAKAISTMLVYKVAASRLDPGGRLDLKVVEEAQRILGLRITNSLPDLYNAIALNFRLTDDSMGSIATFLARGTLQFEFSEEDIEGITNGLVFESDGVTVSPVAQYLDVDRIAKEEARLRGILLKPSARQKFVDRFNQKLFQ